MKPCPWPDNPIFRLPQEIDWGTCQLPVNSETLVPFDHLGTKILIPARCRLCPYLFEGECLFSQPAKPELAAWTAGSGYDLLEAAVNALEQLMTRPRKSGTVLLVVFLVCAAEKATVEVIDEALEKVAEGFPEETNFTWHLEMHPGDNPKSFVFLCAWASG